MPKAHEQAGDSGSRKAAGSGRSARTGGRSSRGRRAEQALREREEREAAILETALDCIVIADEHGRILEFNPAAEKTFGYRRAEAVGKELTETIIPPALREQHRRGLAHYLATGEGPVLGKRVELPAMRADGSEFPVELAITVTHEQGRPAFTAYLRDISERKRAEKALRRAHDELELRVQERTRELEVANHELESFSYSVSHDLRAPLRAMSGYAQELLEEHAESLNEEGRHFLRRIHDNANQMGRLIDDLLAFSRLGRQELKRAGIEMTALARTVLEELKAAHPGREIRENIDPLPRARGDASMVRQVWFNLLSNAVKFTGPRKVARIEIGAVEGAGEHTFRVKDNGVGFDMEYADKLFGVFQRLHGPEEFEGSGVGLALVSRIVERHGGRVWAEGRAGEGATVYFTLPADKETG